MKIGKGYSTEDVDDNNLIVEGRVGIGTTMPHAKLEVVGDLRNSGNIYAGGKVGIGTTMPQAKLEVVGDLRNSGNIYAGGKVGIGTDMPQAKLEVVGDLRNSGNIYAGGKVGIGTTEPAHPLDVKGEIRTSYKYLGKLGKGYCYEKQVGQCTGWSGTSEEWCEDGDYMAGLWMRKTFVKTQEGYKEAYCFKIKCVRLE
jgi:hypothetical protein